MVTEQPLVIDLDREVKDLINKQLNALARRYNAASDEALRRALNERGYNLHSAALPRWRQGVVGKRALYVLMQECLHSS